MASDWYEEMEKAEQEYDARQYELAQEYKRGYEQGRSDAIDELVSKVEKAITEMENNSKIEKTLHNACVVGAIIGTMKRIANELKEKE